LIAVCLDSDVSLKYKNQSRKAKDLLEHFSPFLSASRIVRRFRKPALYSISGRFQHLTTALAIEDFGSRAAAVWSELRPATRGFVERALQTGSANPQSSKNFHYDARADLELSKFLTALDDRIAENANVEATSKVKTVAEACAAVLQEKTESAEVFAQLVLRAQSQRDYRRIDQLADALTSRFPPSEICELARSQEPIVRELANEALARCPISILATLLSDPIDAETARAALRRQVVEYGSEQAKQIVNVLDQSEEQ
jgi:hypothetical protein